MREATSLVLINELIASGAIINVYDPKAKEEAKRFYFKETPNILYCKSKYAALEDCDALVLATEWNEFRCSAFLEIKERLKNPVIFDGRNQYNAKKLQEIGFVYYEIGVGKC